MAAAMRSPPGSVHARSPTVCFFIDTSHGGGGTCSDHSPVYAAFEVDTLRLIPTQPIPREIPLKYTIVITDLWAKVTLTSPLFPLVLLAHVTVVNDELTRGVG